MSEPSDSDSSEEYKQVVVGVCAMAKKTESKPMKEILTRLQEFEYIRTEVFPEDVILNKKVEDWPVVDCLISFHSKGFPLAKAVEYSKLREPYVLNDLLMQYDIQDRRKVYRTLEDAGIELPRYVVLDRDSPNPEERELIESEDSIEVNGIVFNKPFVEKPISAEDHNIFIYYPSSAGGGSQRLFRKIGTRSSVYSCESRVRKRGSFIYEEFMPTDGTDVKVYTVGPDYAHAEARKSPALDGKVERDKEGKEIRYPVILTNSEKLMSRQVCLAFKQTVCGFDLLRASNKSYVCDVNGFSFVKNSMKYYDDCAKIIGNMALRALAPTLHIPWSIPFQLDDPPIVPTTFGKMMELRCVIAVIRHGDRTPKQKMKMQVKHPKFFEMFKKLGGYKDGQVKIKKPHEMQEILDISRFLLAELEKEEKKDGTHGSNGTRQTIQEDRAKLEQFKSVLEMYGHFSGINRKVQMKYQPKGRPRRCSSVDEGNISEASSPTDAEKTAFNNRKDRIRHSSLPNRSTIKSYPRNEQEQPEYLEELHSPAQDPSLVLILKWGGELTPAGRVQAEELGRVFRCMYPGGPSAEFGGGQGLGLLRLHSTFRHDLKIYASDEGRVQMTAAAFAKGLLALEGELTPILVQMVKSANTNGLLDNDCDELEVRQMVKKRLQEYLQKEDEMTEEDRDKLNPTHERSIRNALGFIKNPSDACHRVYDLIVELNQVIKEKKEDEHLSSYELYHGETWDLMQRRWSKLEKDFKMKDNRFDISKIPDIYDCVKHDLLHNLHTLQYPRIEELYMYVKALADVVIPQEYGMTKEEKLTIAVGICGPLLKKIKSDLLRNRDDDAAENEIINRLNPLYSSGVSTPGRHVRTRLYFTSESHIQSLLTTLRFGALFDKTQDEQWRRAMDYVSAVSELNYMTQIVIMLYEDPSKESDSEDRFHIELHFSPGVVCSVQKNLPIGPGFRPHNKNAFVGKNLLFGSEANPVITNNPTRRSRGSCIQEEEDSGEKSEDEEEEEEEEFIQTTFSHESLLEEPSVILEEPESFQPQLDLRDSNEQSSPKSPVSIHIESCLGDCSKKSSCLDVNDMSLDCKPFTLTRSHSISSSSDISRGIESTLSPGKEKTIGTLEEAFSPPIAIPSSAQHKPLAAAHSLTDVSSSSCDNPACIIRNRNHRHSTPGRLSSYLRLCSVVDLPVLGSTHSLFSTAVISGSSSAPDLKDVHLNTHGTTSFPSIRPLETLHNALSLKHLDSFLQRMTQQQSQTSSSGHKSSLSSLNLPEKPNLPESDIKSWDDLLNQ